MSTRYTLLAIGLFLPVAIVADAHAATEPPFCVGPGPESVLACCSAAYGQRDSVAYAALIAPDFFMTDVDHPGEADFDHPSELRAVGRMFRAANLDSLNLEFGAGYTTSPDTLPGSWVLRDVPCTLTIQGMSADGRTGPWVLRQRMTLWVRLLHEPKAHYVIFREELRKPSE